MKGSLKRNRWSLDFAGILVFAVGMSIEFQRMSDSGSVHFDRILSSASMAVLLYVFAFLSVMLAWKRVALSHSWFWISTIGALFHTIGLTITAIPSWFEYYGRFLSNSGISKGQDLLSHSPYLLAYWAMWSISGAVFLVIVRCVASLIYSPQDVENTVQKLS